MTTYLFETNEFAISENGIHLLRSKFNYETIDYSAIEALTIEEGKEVNNWFVILILGICSVTFSVWYILRLLNVLNNYEVSEVSTVEIMLPVIPFMLGHYFIYASTRNGTMLKIKTIDNRSKKFSLKTIEKANTLDEFKLLLQDKLKARVRFTTAV